MSDEQQPIPPEVAAWIAGGSGAAVPARQQLKGRASFPRWAGACAAIRYVAFKTNVTLDELVSEKSWFTEEIFFTASGTPEDLRSFRYNLQRMGDEYYGGK